MPKKTTFVSNVASYIIFAIVCGIFTVRGPLCLADSTPPTTASTVSPTSANGKNGWYTSPVTYSLSATDLESGVKEINYQVDSAPWQKVSFLNTLNLVPNPSLEDPDVGSPIYTKYWIKTSPGNSAVYTRDTSTYAPGFGSVSVKIFSNADGWHTISHPDNFAVASAYTNMNASAWVKTLDSEGTYFKVFAVSLDGLGQKVYTEVVKSSTITGTNDWTQLSTSFVLNVESAIGVYLEIGNEGKGTTWVDAASISNSVTATNATVTIGNDGEHVFRFYSVDRAGNIEPTTSIDVNIDQTPPGNWHESGAIRAIQGSDHELYVYTYVEDDTSGISTLSNKYQYLTKMYPTFGYYENLIACNSTWHSNMWTNLASPSFSSGDNIAYLITPKTDFCSNDWKICKIVKFYAEDVAGNTTIKDYCINGPWIRVTGEGAVGAKAGIDMVAEPVDYNTDGIVEVGNSSISFFISSVNWVIKNQTLGNDYDYDFYWNSVPNKTALGSTLPSSSGIYSHDGNFTVDNSQIPSQYSSKVFNAVVFINGNLTIDKDIEINNSSTLLFIVKGDVKINKSVSKAHFAAIADGTIYTAYDIQEGDAAPTLYLKGIYVANVVKVQRTLQGTGNENDPAEDFTYEPKYLLKLADFLGENSIKWLNDDSD